MLSLKRLIAAVLLTCVLGFTAFADCPVPGQIDTPPCIPAAQPADDSTAPGQMDTPTAVSVPVEVDPVSVAEIALNILTLF